MILRDLIGDAADQPFDQNDPNAESDLPEGWKSRPFSLFDALEYNRAMNENNVNPSHVAALLGRFEDDNPDASPTEVYAIIESTVGAEINGDTRVVKLEG